MITIGICEDELVQLDSMKSHLENIFEKNRICYELLIFRSGEELLKNYPENMDILLLDIKMDKLTGMEVAYKIREFDNDLEIIFTTSFKDYAEEGYVVRAYRYLRKPIDSEKLEEGIMKCIQYVKEKNSVIAIKCTEGLKKIHIEKILYIESIKNYVCIHMEYGSYHAKLSMKEIEKNLLSYNFFRCHKSYLVNLKSITSLNRDNVGLGEKIIPVSKHRYKELKIELTNLLGDMLC